MSQTSSSHLLLQLEVKGKVSVSYFKSLVDHMVFGLLTV